MLLAVLKADKNMAHKGHDLRNKSMTSLVYQEEACMGAIWICTHRQKELVLLDASAWASYRDKHFESMDTFLGETQ